MFKKVFAKYLVFFILLSVSYYGQLFLFKKYNINPSENVVNLAYLVNMFVVILLFVFIDLFKNKFTDQIGFAFMTSSLLKFALFFIFIYPKFNRDGVISKQEMLTFFIPYFVCLIYESLVVGKILNNLKF
jgi:hypothetical protein